jgi:predicted tellurium resistance membrane protein TerC
MRRHLPTLALPALFLLILGFWRPLFGAEDPAAPAAPPPDLAVTVTLADGSMVSGTLVAPGAVTLATDVGSHTIGIEHVHYVTSAPGSTKHADTVALNDKTRHRGSLKTEAFVVRTEEGERSIAADQVRHVKFDRRRQASASTIVIGLLTLTAMEIVLGIDNIIFLAILVGKLPTEQQPRARRIGLGAALGTRLLLLLTLSFILGLTKPVFTLPDLPFLHDLEAREISFRDVILLAGGLFLIGKSTFEMHEKLEHASKAAAGAPEPTSGTASFAKVIFQIAIIDIVFSLDSVITAVGMVDQIWVMVVAMVIAMGVMLAFAAAISNFVARHPTIKMLALSFLILIGVMLVAEGLGQHIDKGYIYFAMAFAVLVEMLNLRLRKSNDPVHLHRPTY